MNESEKYDVIQPSVDSGRESAGTENTMSPPASEDTAQARNTPDMGQSSSVPQSADSSKSGIDIEKKAAAPTATKTVAEPKFEDDGEQPTRCAKIFNALAHVGPIVLVVAICLMVWADFWEALGGKAYYCPPEVKYMTSWLHAADHGDWLTPSALAGSEWISQWPLYTWLLWALSYMTTLSGMPLDLIFPLAASLCATLAVIGVWAFSLAARFGSPAAFAAGIILLCAPIFAPLPHFVGPSVFSTALLLISLAFFCRGWLRERAWLSLPLGFICCGLAGMSGGIFHFSIPLLSSFFFLLWRGKFKRGQGKDALFGFLLLLILLGCWISVVILAGNDSAYLSTIFKSGYQFSWPPRPLWWLAFVIAGIGLLPWILTVFGVSWLRVTSRCVSSLRASRHDNGSALVWIALVIACLLAPFFTHDTGGALVLCCLAAPLLGKAFLQMPSLGNRFFFFLASLLAILGGLIMLASSFAFSQKWLLAISLITMPNWIQEQLLNLSALPVMGSITLLAGIIGMAVFARHNHEGGGLVFSLLVSIFLAQPGVLMLAPELGANPGSGLATFGKIQTIYKNAVQQPAAADTSPAQMEQPAQDEGQIKQPEPLVEQAAPKPEAVEQKTADPQHDATPEESAPAPVSETVPTATQPAPNNSTEQPNAASVPDNASPAPVPPHEKPAANVDGTAAQPQTGVETSAETAENPTGAATAEPEKPAVTPEIVKEEIIIETIVPEKTPTDNGNEGSKPENNTEGAPQ